MCVCSLIFCYLFNGLYIFFKGQFISHYQTDKMTPKKCPTVVFLFDPIHFHPPLGFWLVCSYAVRFLRLRRFTWFHAKLLLLSMSANRPEKLTKKNQYLFQLSVESEDTGGVSPRGLNWCQLCSLQHRFDKPAMRAALLMSQEGRSHLERSSPSPGAWG